MRKIIGFVAVLVSLGSLTMPAVAGCKPGKCPITVCPKEISCSSSNLWVWCHTEEVDCKMIDLICRAIYTYTTSKCC